MKSQFLKYSFQLFLVIMGGMSAYAQEIIDLNSDNPYKKVFVDTDNFGPSYLEILEAAYPKIEEDSIKYSVLNDLAYYWHTRDLDKALNFTKIGLDLTREKKNLLWEGRFQITEAAIFLRMEKLDSALFERYRRKRKPIA